MKNNSPTPFFAIISVASLITLAVYKSNIESPIMCEAPLPFNTDNLFFKIQESSKGA